MECELPASLTARALKKVLPPRAGATRDARVTLNSAASMFTLYLSSVAQDHSAANKRQTIILKDVLQALRDMDLEHFIGPIEDCVRETKAAAALKKTKSGADKVAAADDDAGDDNDDAMASVEEEEDDAIDDDDAEDTAHADENVIDDDADDDGAEEDDVADTGAQDVTMADGVSST